MNVSALKRNLLQFHQYLGTHYRVYALVIILMAAIALVATTGYEWTRDHFRARKGRGK